MNVRPVVLCCEDETETQDALVRRLGDDAYQVHAVGDVAECLDWLSRRRCDLVLMDVAKPVSAGIECVRQIRRSYSHDALPIIIVSALADSGNVVSGLEAGANDYVVKPINLSILDARIRVCLRIRSVVGALVEAERQRVMIETLGRSAARLAEPITRMIDTLEHLTEPPQALAAPAATSSGQIEHVLGVVEEVVGVMERLQAAGRAADVPYARRLDLLVNNESSSPEV